METIRFRTGGEPLFEAAMTLYESSFPIHEQRTRRDQLRAMEQEDFFCTAAVEGDALVGLLWYWRFDGGIYVEHFAVAPLLRGAGHGSRILAELCAHEPDTLLEIDPPVDELSRRRLDFYTRLGFRMQPFAHVHPPYRKGFQGHELKVLTFARDWMEAEYQRFAAFLKEDVMSCSETV